MLLLLRILLNVSKKEKVKKFHNGIKEILIIVSLDEGSKIR